MTVVGWPGATSAGGIYAVWGLLVPHSWDMFRDVAGEEMGLAAHGVTSALRHTHRTPSTSDTH